MKRPLSIAALNEVYRHSFVYKQCITKHVRQSIRGNKDPVAKFKCSKSMLKNCMFKLICKHQSNFNEIFPKMIYTFIVANVFINYPWSVNFEGMV
jgi:hypothetical protein